MTENIRFTASGANRAPFCLYSFRTDIEKVPSFSSLGASIGTEVHQAIDFFLSNEERKPISSQASTLFRVWQEEFFQNMPSLDFDVEHAFAWNTQTDEACSLGKIEPRNYPYANDTVFGTVDCVFYDYANKRAIIYDWKTSFDEIPIAKSEQLKTLAVLVSKTFELEQVTVILAKISPEGMAYESLELNQEVLMAQAEIIKKWVQEIPSAAPKAGSWCKRFFCNRFGICPATTGEIMQKERHLAVVNHAEIQSREHAKAVYQAWERAKAQVDKVGAALRLWSLQNGMIETEEGKSWGAHKIERESIEITSRDQIRVLSAVLGDHVDKAITFETTKTAIKSACRAYALEKGSTVVSVERQVFAALEACGAVKRKEIVTYAER